MLHDIRVLSRSLWSPRNIPPQLHHPMADRRRANFPPWALIEGAEVIQSSPLGFYILDTVRLSFSCRRPQVLSCASLGRHTWVDR